MSYCDLMRSLSGDRLKIHKKYHDQSYGFPIHDDNELFCRLVLEINQAGLSWETILKKENNFRIAFHNFNVQKVARYNGADRKRLLKNAGIIRNRLKVDAAIHNAKAIVEIQKTHGSLQKWLLSHHPQPLIDWVKLFKKTFRFTGGEIVNEFLMSTGYLPGAHMESCPIHKKVLRSKPAWSSHAQAKKKLPA